jgi:transposase
MHDCRNGGLRVERAHCHDMNPIEHVWDFIGRKINQRNPKCQDIDELRSATLQEWQQFPQERLRRLV